MAFLQTIRAFTASAAQPLDQFHFERAPPPSIRSRWPQYSEDEIQAVSEVLRSGRVNSLYHGDCCRAFERAFANMCDMPFAISLANGTLALELALRALAIGPGDDVVVPSRSFIASASCVRSCGANPVFADVHPDSQNITAVTMASALTPRTKAVIVVHLAGWPCDMDALSMIAKAHGIKVIEDCAQAHGAMYKGRPVGSLGDAAAFSFCTDKIMSTGGEGGLLLLRDKAAWNRAWSYKDHGKDPDLAGAPSGTSFRWLHTSIGSNYRMTEMQAAIGLCQMTKLSRWLRDRRRNAALLNDILEGLPSVRITRPPREADHAYYKYYAFVRPARLKPDWCRDRIIGEIIAAGAPCSSGICPEIYREKAFAGTHSEPKTRLGNARSLGETSLMLPIDPTLDQTAIRSMGKIARAVLMEAAT